MINYLYKLTAQQTMKNHLKIKKIITKNKHLANSNSTNITLKKI